MTTSNYEWLQVEYKWLQVTTSVYRIIKHNKMSIFHWSLYGNQLNNRSDIELTFLLSLGESLFNKTDILKDSLNASFSRHKIEKSLKATIIMLMQ